VHLPGSSSEIHRPFPTKEGSAFPASVREHDFPRPVFRGCSYFVMFKPPSLLAFQIVPTAANFCRAAKAFTSELNVCRYLHTHRIRYPPDYRQLAVRGLAPRWIRSVVGCSPSLHGMIGNRLWNLDVAVISSMTTRSMETLLVATFAITLVQKAAAQGNKEPEVQTQILLSASSSWDGEPYQSYPSGQPELVGRSPASR
jgi:hypothetical protein